MADPRSRGDSGASLVEFALILPVFFTLLLAMFTGGLAYSRKLSTSSAAREGARFGATLPLSGSTDDWLRRVADVTVGSSDGELAPTESGAFVCVAYVPASGTPRRIERAGTSTAFSNAACFADTRGSETRVQVIAQRTSTLEALVWSRDLVLTSRAVARYEAV